MIHPLVSSAKNLQLIAKRNRLQDESCLLDYRKEFYRLEKNTCSFPTKAYVINKPDRLDRWEKFCSSNHILFEEFEVQRWEASLPSKDFPEVRDAIFQSYISCLESSLESEESVIIMEDDSYLVEGAIEKIKKSWEDLPENWDVLIGNHYFFGEMKILTDHLSKPVRQASTINFGIFRRSVLPKIKENLHLKDSLSSIKDFDHFLTSEVTPIENYTIWPMISREFSSYSDHKGRFLDSNVKIIEHAYKYRFIDEEKFYPSLPEWSDI